MVIHFLICSFTNCSYCVAVISPLRHCDLVLLTSGVCGKLPMVVVGKVGSCKISFCFCIRFSNGTERTASDCFKFSMSSFCRLSVRFFFFCCSHSFAFLFVFLMVQYARHLIVLSFQCHLFVACLSGISSEVALTLVHSPQFPS